MPPRYIDYNVLFFIYKDFSFTQRFFFLFLLVQETRISPSLLRALNTWDFYPTNHSIQDFTSKGTESAEGGGGVIRGVLELEIYRKYTTEQDIIVGY